MQQDPDALAAEAQRKATRKKIVWGIVIAVVAVIVALHLLGIVPTHR